MTGSTDMCKGKFTIQTLKCGNTNCGGKKTKKKKNKNKNRKLSFYKKSGKVGAVHQNVINKIQDKLDFPDGISGK